MSASTNVFDDLKHEASAEIVAAFLIQGNRSAKLVGTFLVENQFIQPNKRRRFPRWFLLDLGYALQLREWEQQNLVQHLPRPLPSSKSVIQTIVEKLRASADRPRSRTKPDQKLAHLVTTAFLLHFCHFRESGFQGDFILKTADRAHLIETMAQWLWKHRQSNI